MQNEVRSPLPSHLIALFVLAELQTGIPNVPVKPVVTNFFASHTGIVGILFFHSVEGKESCLPKGFLMLEGDL